MTNSIGRAFQCVFVVLAVFAPIAAASHPQGDFNANCRIEMADVEILAAHWLDSQPCSDPVCGDLTGGQGVYLDDFAAFASHWSCQCELEIDTDMPFEDGYYHTNTSSITLAGTAPPLETRAVRVAGRLARWSDDTGDWSIGPRQGWTETEILLPAGSSWKWLDDGSNQHGPADGLDWYGHLDYNDANWFGPAPAKFGYEDDGEITPVSWGPDRNNKYITTYFRTTFDVEDVSEFASLKARLLRDDGAVVYLNGNPMPAVRDRISTEPFDYLTEADDPAVGGDDEDTFFEHDVNLPLLVNGINLVAAEVHQVSPTSSDLGFDLEFVATRKSSPADEGIALDPNANTIVVQTFADPCGLTTPLQTTQIDIWFDEPVITTLSGTLTADAVIVSGSTVTVTGDVIIPAGITLEIRAGAVLRFADAAGITVNAGGRLIAEGTPANRILMTTDTAATRWDGISFDGTDEDNRLICVDMEHGDQQGRSLDIDHSRIFLDDMTWVTTGATPVMELHNPQAYIRNCTIPTVPSGEPVHGSGLSGDQYCIFEGNTFGRTSGYNDVIDFTGGKRPGPIIQFYNNTFLGGGDDGPDLDGTDAHVEGNFFTNFHQTTPTQDSPSYAVATGDGSEVCVVRNVFVDNDHCILHKEDVYSWFANNTCIASTIADISFGEPFRSYVREPGRGIYGSSNIFYGTVAVFEHLYDNPVDYGPSDVYMYRSIMPAEWHNPPTWDRLGVEHTLGTGNIDADPCFASPNDDLTLLAASVAVAAGTNGLDMGAFVPAGASVSGVTETVTDQTEMTLTVGGPGITHYKWRLVDDGALGPWSAEIALPVGVTDFPADPDNTLATLHLTGLQDGHTYRVDVIGKNSAYHWQGQRFLDTEFIAPGNPEGNSTPSWIVSLD
ncbi:MAG: hypothetical protein JW720_05655 [Sedimentisphaerales bacterium]|nr:hypothetical protein [Sedimentisphaerales bacterium]